MPLSDMTLCRPVKATANYINRSGEEKIEEKENVNEKKRKKQHGSATV